MSSIRSISEEIELYILRKDYQDILKYKFSFFNCSLEATENMMSLLSSQKQLEVNTAYLLFYI